MAGPSHCRPKPSQGMAPVCRNANHASTSCGLPGHDLLLGWYARVQGQTGKGPSPGPGRPISRPLRHEAGSDPAFTNKRLSTQVSGVTTKHRRGLKAARNRNQPTPQQMTTGRAGRMVRAERKTSTQTRFVAARCGSLAVTSPALHADRQSFPIQAGSVAEAALRSLAPRYVA